MRSLGILLVIATFNLAQALLELDPDSTATRPIGCCCG